jgi:hypothetical protein
VESELHTHVHQLGKEVIFCYKNRWAGLCTLYEDFLRLEIILTMKSQINEKFSRPKQQTVKVLLDRMGNELKDTLENRPDSLNYRTLYNETLRDFGYMSVVATQYFLKGEYWNTRHALEVALVPLYIRSVFLLENQEFLLLESNKRLEQFLPAEYLKKLIKMSPSYNQTEISESLKYISREFHEIAQLIATKINTPFPQNEALRILNYVQRI